MYNIVEILFRHLFDPSLLHLQSLDIWYKYIQVSHIPIVPPFLLVLENSTMYLLEDHLFRATLLLRGAMGATRETFPGVLCDNLTPPLVARKIYYIARTICLQSMGNVANLAKYTHIVHIGTACIYIHIYIYTRMHVHVYMYISLSFYI
jgi:hypothetical protein